MKNWNQGSLSRHILPEEKIPKIDEALIPDYSKQKELLEKVSMELEDLTLTSYEFHTNLASKLRISHKSR